MEITNNDVKVLGRVVSITTEGVVADAEQILDSSFSTSLPNKFQHTINEYLVNRLESIDESIAENIADIETLNDKVSGLTSGVDSLRGDVFDLQQATSGIASVVNTLSGRVDQDNTTLYNFGERLARFQQSVDRATVQVAGLITDVDDLKSAGYITQEYVDNAVDGLATEEYVDVAVDGLATQEYVDQVASEIVTSDSVFTVSENKIYPKTSYQTYTVQLSALQISPSVYITGGSIKLSGGEIQLQNDARIYGLGTGAYMSNIKYSGTLQTDGIQLGSGQVYYTGGNGGNIVLSGISGISLKTGGLPSYVYATDGTILDAYPLKYIRNISDIDDIQSKGIYLLQNDDSNDYDDPGDILTVYWADSSLTTMVQKLYFAKKMRSRNQSQGIWTQWLSMELVTGGPLQEL